MVMQVHLTTGSPKERAELKKGGNMKIEKERRGRLLGDRRMKDGV